VRKVSVSKVKLKDRGTCSPLLNKQRTGGKASKGRTTSQSQPQYVTLKIEEGRKSY
jgi:hypothetical protein